MPKVDIIINRSLETVWKSLTEKANWKEWWGGDLAQVSPGWQKGGKLIWANGNKSSISKCSKRKVLQITSTFIQHTYSLKSKGKGSTLFVVTFSPRGGANFSDGGRAHRTELASNLKKFKKLVEKNSKKNQTEKPKTKNIFKKFWNNLKDRLFQNQGKRSEKAPDDGMSIDNKLSYDIKAEDLKVLSVYSNNPRKFLSIAKAKDYTTAALRFFEFADSSFIDKIKPFIDSGTLKCQVFFEKLKEMGIQEAYPKIKADLSQKDLIHNDESLVLLNFGIMDKSDLSFLMLIGVMVIADNQSTVNFVSAEKINENLLKIILSE